MIEYKDFKTIVFDGVETNYGINKNGDVVNYITGKKLSHQSVAGHPQHEYPSVKIMVYYKDKKIRKIIRIHRQLAIHFIPKDDPENKTEVNHIDGDKTNFSLGNLEWCSHRHNVQHAYDNGLILNNKKLSDVEIRRACVLLEKGYTNRQVSKITGVGKNTISEIRSGKNWTYISKDYIIPDPNTKPNMYFTVEQVKRIEDILSKGYVSHVDAIIKYLGVECNNTTRSFIKHKRKKIQG